MNPYEMQPAPHSWPPKITPWLIGLLRPLRNRLGVREHGLHEVSVTGAAHVQDALESGSGVLITPNHSAHADPFAMYSAADQIGTPVHFMATWHVFANRTWIGRRMLQRHGVFSVDREGADLRAFKMATGTLQESPYPLVIFPEGEIYHTNERLTPFREGPATIALAAARRAERPIICVPCAIRYTYATDPTPGLHEVMSELERRIHWRPRPDVPLAERIYDFAEALLMLKEREYLGQAGSGPLPERIAVMIEHLLRRLEERYELDSKSACVPKRVKELRQRTLVQIQNSEDGISSELHRDLEDLFLAVQLFSYPGTYVAENPSIERMAETLDKFEEDVLRRNAPTIRGRRQATVHFLEPIPVEAGSRSREAAVTLTEQLERAVQDRLSAEPTG